jgi:hypothetical protein
MFFGGRGGVGCVPQGKAARKIWLIRAARGRRERGEGGVSRVRLDRSQKTLSNQLIQPEPIKHLSSKSPARAWRPPGQMPRLQPDVALAAIVGLVLVADAAERRVAEIAANASALIAMRTTSVKPPAAGGS